MELDKVENKMDEIIRLMNYEQNRIGHDKFSLNHYGSETLLTNYYEELEELRNKRNSLLKD